MDLKMTLIQRVREAQTATTNAAAEFGKVTAGYDLTHAGKEQQAQALFGAAQSVAVAARDAGFAAIDAKITELNAQEQSAAAARMADNGYLERLETKLRMLTRMEADKMPDDVLKAYFAEFANDPIAINSIEKYFKHSMRGANIAPENTTGKRQEHLSTVVRAAFERAINRAGAELPPVHDLATGAIFGHESEIEGFISYVQKQNDDFSLDDLSIWEDVRGQSNPAAEDIHFGFAFRNVHG